ncbi:MAG: ABC transporter ATP-binding protein [Verrucomicrobia bacterium]|nr:ABC transporter ATP-binding protein [Verrucomicrobiota bacterium]
MNPILEVRDLCVDFCSRGNVLQAVKNVSFDLNRGEILAVVGESGSGKSVTSQSLVGLLPGEPLCRVRGSVKLEGREILGLPERELRKIRGREIAYIFQDPMSSLNPVYTIGWQIEEALRFHVPALKTARARRERVREVLAAVGIKPDLADAFPHQFSGGMQQRAMIAMALACEPKILVADEPTTALDVTIQKQITDLLVALRECFKMSVLLITHNFGIVAQIADRAVVLFRGEKVEEGIAAELIKNPQHAYTKALLACVPRLKEHSGKSAE